METEQPDVQDGLVVASNDYVFSAEEVWDLITQDQLNDDENGRETYDTVDSKQGYGLMAVIDENGDLQSKNRKKIPCVEHSEKLLLHALYCTSHTRYAALE